MRFREPAPPESVRVALHVGEALLAEAVEESLTKGERARLADLRGPRRRLEFLAGRTAARRALSKALDITDGIDVLPDVDGAPKVMGSPSAVAISISHGRRRAVAVVGTFRRLGIDHCELQDADRLAAIAPRYLADELHLLSSAWSYAACWAAKEAGLKALRLGLLDGGMFDPGQSAIQVVSLDPPQLAPPNLSLMFGDVPEGPVAIVWGR